MKLNLLETKNYYDKEICSKCKHYKTAIINDHERQVIDAFCIECYSDKVSIVCRFEKVAELKK